jgi:adenylate cyclase
VTSSRRLAAIMFTDMVGSTAAAQTNESAALRLRDEQERLVRPLFTAHAGRAVKSIGDGFLVVFDSALRAVECAVDIQDQLHARNARPGTPPIRLRVGIHLGDVEEKEGDIFGDSVNVASRIEPLADPGGICISESVFAQVRNKVANPLDKLEPRSLKGVLFPMDVYRVRLAWTGPTPSPAEADAVPLEMRRIVVLPFANFSPDPADEYFADGMTEELIEKLAHVSGIRVIARTTAMHYKNRKDTALEIGRELRVGSVVECSIRKAGHRLRITAQLIDTRSEEHLWASRYDRDLDDVFAVQDDIAGRIADSLAQHLAPRIGETRPSFAPAPRDTQDLEAYTLYLHGRKLLADRASEATIRQAVELFEKAIARDPRFARARVGLAEAVLWLSGEGDLPWDEANARCRRELDEALRVNDDLAEAHSALAGLLLGLDELEGSMREARRAIALNPSLSDPYRWLAQLEGGEGRIEETVRLLETAHQLDPLDVNVISFLGRSYAYAGREAEALAFWERTRALSPYRTAAHLTEYYLGKGDYARAEELVQELERRRPNNSWTETYRGMLAARTGDVETARAIIDRLHARAEAGEMTVLFQGFVWFALGDQEAFVACMEEAFRLHSLPLLELRYSPLYRAARADPRISELIRKQAAMRGGTS